jgi:hypothetical protein
MEEQNVPFVEFVFVICAANLPILLLALFFVVIALRKLTISWLRIVVFSIPWALVSNLTALALILSGYFSSITGNGLLDFYTPVLIATLITTAPLFLLRRKEAPTLHSRDEA